MAIKRWLLILMPVIGVLIVWIWLNNQPTPPPALIYSDVVTMLPSTVDVSPEVHNRIVKVLETEYGAIGAKNFIITNADYAKPYWYVSVAAMPDQLPEQINISHAVWLGVITVVESATDATMPAEVQSANPSTEEPGITGYGGAGNILPFRSGTNAVYGEAGVHSCGFNLSTWRAVDLFPTENMVYASQSGEVSYVCRDSKQVAIKIGNMLYDHLADTGQKIGDKYDQGQQLGSLVPGTFDTMCGYAAQQPEAFHVHWCFTPNPGGTFVADGYALNVYNNNWVRDGASIGPTGILTANWANADTGVKIPGPTSGANIWDWYTGGFVSIVNHFIPVLPSHAAIDLATRLISIAAVPLKIVYITLLSNFDMTVASWAINIFFVLEGVRLLLAGILLLKNLKQLIPFLG